MGLDTRHIRRYSVWLAVMVLVLPLLASNSWGKDLRKITFRYSWILYGHAPAYYYAKDLGLWEKEGLDVTILTGKGSGHERQAHGSRPGPLRHRGLRHHDEGRGARHSRQGVFGELQIHPMSVAIPAKHGASKPADLAGKSIAVTAGGGDQAMLPAFLNANGLQGKVKVVQLSSGGAKREALLQGKVDAIVAYVNEQVPQIEAQGVKLNVLKFAENGAPLLGVGIIINVKTLEDGDLIRKFLRGLSGGIRAAMKNPDAAADSRVEGVQGTQAGYRPEGDASELPAVPDPELQGQTAGLDGKGRLGRRTGYPVQVRRPEEEDRRQPLLHQRLHLAVARGGHGRNHHPGRRRFDDIQHP